MKSSHFFQLDSFFSHSSNVSSVGGSKPHLDDEPVAAAAAATTGAAFGGSGFFVKALLILNSPNRLV